MVATSIKKSPVAQVGSFIHEAREELRKVSWPSREQTIRYSVIVIVGSIGVSLITGAMDYLLTLAIEQLIL